MAEVYDLLILGAGPSGMAAAIYGGRYGLKTLVVGKDIGGTANFSWEIENYPGFKGSGIDLMKKFEEQAKSFGAEFEVGHIDKLERVEEGFKISVDDKVFVGRSVVSGLGSERRKLGISGEDEFLGKGVSYCATCDGNFFRNKTVVVVGGSDSAAKAAIYLSGICKKVYISYRKDKMRCEPISLEKIEAIENIEIIYDSKPVEIIGDMKVSGLKLEIENGESVLDVDGVFIEVGSVPVTRIFEELEVELENGYIKVDKEGRTSVEGLFAAGDGTNNSFKQVVTAAADGALAAKSAYDFLKFGDK
ncbi:MAG: FAD-dependent oxidoreductase [Nanoarchaeota archaeon]|nr:FAD-dependent oxidoreductase [Nanoarchaeota archaeon]